MPVQKGKSVLSGLGNAFLVAHEAAKNEETRLGNANLPAGINGGIAQLVECKVDTVKKQGPDFGKPFFHAAGIVKSPLEHEGIPIEGLRTFINEPLYDTPTKSRKTIKEHVSEVYNHLRLLGVNTKEMDPNAVEVTMEALKKQAPHFRFETWKGEKATEGKYKDKEPLTNHKWLGACEFTDQNGDGGDVDDQTGGDDTPPPAAAPPTRKGPGKPAAKAPEPEPEPENTEDAGEATLQEMGAMGDAGDVAAQEYLTAKAAEVGMSDEERDAETNWLSLAAAIEARESGDAEPAAEEEAAWEPAVGEQYNYEIVGPNKKKTKVLVEVTSVDSAKQLVGLKNVKTPKVTYKGIAWDKLESA